MKNFPKTRFELFSYSLTGIEPKKSTAKVLESFYGFNGVYYCPHIHLIAKNSGMSVQAVKRAISLGINDGSIIQNSAPKKSFVCLVKFVNSKNQYGLLVSNTNFLKTMEIEENNLPPFEYIAVFFEPQYEKYTNGYHSGDTFETAITEPFKKKFVSLHSKKHTHIKSRFFYLNANQLQNAINFLNDLYITHISQYKEINVLQSKIKMVAEYRKIKKSDAEKYAKIYSKIFV
jgi:hypothetical protein